MTRDDSLPPPPADLPRPGDAFRHWLRGTIYVVTGVARNEANPAEFDVLYKLEGAPEDAIPWRRTYTDFVMVMKVDGKDVLRFEFVGKRQVSYCRPEVMAFARAMEAKLRLNAHKGTWKEDDPFDLLARVVDEIDELDVAIEEYSGGPTEETRKAVLSEAADVANFCLFTADVCGSLKGGVSAEGVYSTP